VAENPADGAPRDVDDGKLLAQLLQIPARLRRNQAKAA
jgi:hypothetical protein